MGVLKEAYGKYGKSRDGWIKFVFNMRICDKSFSEKFTTAMFGL